MLFKTPDDAAEVLLHNNAHRIRNRACELVLVRCDNAGIHLNIDGLVGRCYLLSRLSGLLLELLERTEALKRDVVGISGGNNPLHFVEHFGAKPADATCAGEELADRVFQRGGGLVAVDLAALEAGEYVRPCARVGIPYL